jgi:Mn2+ and Fe2+ transporters of the NRAMP family
MKKLLGVTLGIMTALGGFVDLGQIVFTMQAGSLFGYQLLWAVVLGTVAIIVYMEMCGRVAVSRASRYSRWCAIALARSSASWCWSLRIC